MSSYKPQPIVEQKISIDILDRVVVSVVKQGYGMVPEIIIMARINDHVVLENHQSLPPSDLLSNADRMIDVAAGVMKETIKKWVTEGGDDEGNSDR